MTDQDPNVLPGLQQRQSSPLENMESLLLLHSEPEVETHGRRTEQRSLGEPSGSVTTRVWKLYVICDIVASLWVGSISFTVIEEGRTFLDFGLPRLEQLIQIAKPVDTTGSLDFLGGEYHNLGR